MAVHLSRRVYLAIGEVLTHPRSHPIVDELAHCWRAVVAAYPGFAVYRDRTDRTVPIFRLEPIAAGA